MYGSPQRAMRPKAQNLQQAREVASFYGDGEAVLARVDEYLSREWRRSLSEGDRVRTAALKGARSVVSGARYRVMNEEVVCPF
jgi:hypothetical protein